MQERSAFQSVWHKVTGKWYQWTEPDPQVTKDDARQKAQLISSILLFFLPFIILHLLSLIGYDKAVMLPMVIPAILLLTAVIALYLLSRTNHFQWAAIGLVILLSAFPFLSIVVGANYDPIAIFNALAWLLPAILAGIFLLSYSQNIIQVILILVAVVLLTWLNPNLSFTLTIRPLTLITVTAVLVLLFRGYLMVQEKAQLKKEQELSAEARQSEQKFRLLFEQAPIGMSITDPDGRYLQVNQAYCDAVGYSAEELLERSFLDITHPDDRQTDLDMRQKLFCGDIASFTVEKRFIHKTGRMVHGLLQASLERNAAGQPVRVIAQNMDVTERKQSEATRREQQQLLQGFIDNTPALVFVKDLDGRYLLVNHQFENAANRDHAHIVGFTDYDLFPPHMADALRQHDQTALEMDTAVQFEEYSNTITNQVIYLSVKFPLHDTNGKAYALAGISTNITEQKKTEAALRQHAAQLEALRQVGLEISTHLELDSLLQSIISRAVGILEGNRGALWLYNPEHDVLQLVANYLGQLGIGLTMERGEGMTGFVWETGQSLVIPNYSEWAGRSEKLVPHMKDSSVVAVPVFWAGTVQGAISIAKDQSDSFTNSDADLLSLFAAQAAIAIENARLHERIQQHAHELARSNQDLQDFAYAASHDLQEPLRKIQTFGDRLQSRYGDVLDERGQDYLARMQQAAARMQTLIVDLLSLSRVTTQARPFTAVDLNKILTTVLNDLDMRIEETQAVIQVDPLPILEADETQMTQLFLNLLNNALKFTVPNQPPFVHIHSEPATGKNRTAFIITVSDNGIGFDEQHLERIFGVFQRLHGRQEYEGSGVGLAICQKIVNRHDGLITARSQPGAGATFIITLPARQTVSRH